MKLDDILIKEEPRIAEPFIANKQGDYLLKIPKTINKESYNDVLFIFALAYNKGFSEGQKELKKEISEHINFFKRFE